MRRRRLLQAGGTLGVALMAGACTLPVIPRRPAPSADEALGWVQHRDGRWRLLLPRVEMGQNIATALKQVACDELGIAWDALEVRLPRSDQLGRVRATVGSASVQDFALLLAQACATLREAVAAGHPAGRLVAQPRPMAQLRAFQRGAAGTGGGQRHVGRAMPIEQGQAIVRGLPLYAADVRREGMVYGRVLHAPASPELRSRLLGCDETAARAQPGFVALVHDPLLALGGSEGLGLVARTPAGLDAIEAALQPRWSTEGRFDAAEVDALVDVDARLARGSLAHAPLGGRIDRPAGPWDVDLRIDIPLAPHGAIEPRAAVAEFDGQGRLLLWVGSQDPFYMRDVVAKRLGLAEEQVLVQACRVGGAFGGKTLCTVELEAALLARAVQRPVKLQWSRAQELAQGFHRPPSSHRLRARLREGRIEQWWHAFASSHILFTNAGLPRWLQRFTDVVGDDGVARGAVPPYGIPHRRVEFDLQRLPVYTGPWRGLGAGPNGVAIESAIDECALKAGIDPLLFRLRHIEQPRLQRVLQQVADAAGWHRPLPPAGAGQRRGRGLACGIYKGASHAAVVAEVALDDAGALRVTRLVCAHDCGLLIHPGQVRAQCEGNLVWGLGMVTGDALPLADGRVAASSFAEAPIPRFATIPPMEVLLVDEGDPPGGAGETVIVAAAAAILNAVRAATGRRPTRLPLRAQDLTASAG